MELAFSLAAEAAAQVHRTVFNAVMQGDADEWQHSRYLLYLNYDSRGRPTLPPCAADCDGPDGGVLQQPAAAHCRRRDHGRDRCTAGHTGNGLHAAADPAHPTPRNAGDAAGEPRPAPRVCTGPARQRPPAPVEGLLRMTFR